MQRNKPMKKSGEDVDNGGRLRDEEHTTKNTANHTWRRISPLLFTKNAFPSISPGTIDNGYDAHLISKARFAGRPKK